MLVAAAALTALGLVGAPASAGTSSESTAQALTVYSNPVATYTNNTCVYLVGNVADRSSVTQLNQCGVQLSFSRVMDKRSVPNSWNGGWEARPYTEGPTPGILYSGTAKQVNITLSRARNIFGFELKGDHFATNTFTVKFQSATGANLGSITRTLTATNTGHGARLFAAKSTVPIKKVLITGTDGFALAKIRVAF